MAPLASPLAFPLAGSSSDASAVALRDALGQDIYYTTFFPLTAAGDLITIEGVAALKQAIRVRLLTNPGELPWAPTFGVGIEDYVGDIGTAAKVAELKRRLKENLLLDSRIQAVTALDVAERTINAEVVLVVTMTVTTSVGTQFADEMGFTARSEVL